MNEQLRSSRRRPDDARLRSLVSETPLATHEYGEVQRHADAMARARDAVAATVADLEATRTSSCSTSGSDPLSPAPRRRPARAGQGRDRRGRGHHPARPEGDPRLGRLRGGGRDRAAATRRSSWSPSTKPDLAILDVKMPGMTASQAAREITSADARSRSWCSPPSASATSSRTPATPAWRPISSSRSGATSCCRAIDSVLATLPEEWAIEDEIETFGRRCGRRGQDRDPPAGRRGQGRADGPATA